MAPIPQPTNDVLLPLYSRLALIPRSFSIVAKQTIAQLLGRQTINPSDPVVPATYGSINSGPSPGTVVGIVLGSVGGFLLLLWLFYTCMNFGGVSSSSSYTESVVIRDRRKSNRGSSHTTRSRRASETVEVRRERSPVRIVREPERVERVIVEERVQRSRERSLGESDEVVVIEEHSPPRRKKSVREDRDRRDSGYRTVDPLAYGGTVGGRKTSSRRSSGR